MYSLLKLFIHSLSFLHLKVSFNEYCSYSVIIKNFMFVLLYIIIIINHIEHTDETGVVCKKRIALTVNYNKDTILIPLHHWMLEDRVSATSNTTYNWRNACMLGNISRHKTACQLGGRGLVALPCLPFLADNGRCFCRDSFDRKEGDKRWGESSLRMVTSLVFTNWRTCNAWRPCFPSS